MPPKRSKKRLATKPKRYFADPSLAAALLLLSPDSLLADGQTFGLVFENLCIRDLKVYAQAMDPSMPAAVYYYRDDSGLEADAVIETLDGRWAAFEFKLSEEKVPDAVKSLRRLRKKVAENPRAQGRPPEFLCVITGIGSYAREVEEGIYVVPLRALGRLIRCTASCTSANPSTPTAWSSIKGLPAGFTAWSERIFFHDSF